MANFDLYEAAKRADDHYHDLLIRVYGAKDAGSARYRPRHEDPSLEDARAAKRQADEAWLEEMRLKNPA